MNRWFLLLWVGSVIAATGCKDMPPDLVQSNAEKNARRYAQGLGLETLGAQCSDADGDGDCYVSCTLSVRDGDGIMLKAVECGYRAEYCTGQSGCKLALPKTHVAEDME